VADLNVANSALRPQADTYLKKIRQAADTRKVYEAALTDIKDENWTGARQKLQDLVDRKTSMSGEAKKKLSDVSTAQKALETFNQSLKAGAYHDAKNQLDAMQWQKTKVKLQQELQLAEQTEANNIKGRAESLQAGGDLDGLVHLQEELHNFAERAESPDLVQWAKVNFDSWLVGVEKKLGEKQGDKASFDAAVSDFNATKEKGGLNRMSHEVLQKFQKLANGSGTYGDQAQTYVSTTIPAAMQEMRKLGSGKAIVPPIACVGGQGATAAPANTQGMTCAKLDTDVSLQWLGTPEVEFPASANQPGKLPYTLRLIVTVEANGKVKVEKDGNADKDFLKKAKDAAKNWKATIPKAGSKPVSVSFPLAITFQR